MNSSSPTGPTDSASQLLTVLLGRSAPVRIHVPQPDEQVVVRARAAVSSSRHPAPRSVGEFSRYECVGDESSIKPRVQRACLFRRVCLDTRSGEFTYHRRPDLTPAPVLFDRRYGHLFHFRHEAEAGQGERKSGAEDFLGLNKHVRYKDHVRWSPLVVERPLPNGDEAVHLRTLALLSAPFVPTNLGHVVWEEAFPLLLAMAQLGAYESRAIVLRTRGCNESAAGVPSSASEALLCTKFVDGFLRPLQGSRSAGLWTLQALRARHFPKPVCFQKMIVGGFFDMFNGAHHAGKEPFIQERLFRHRVLRFHGISPTASPPASHLLLLVRKQGRRGIFNFDQVKRHIRNGCAGQCQGIKRVEVASFHTMTVRAQLALVSRSTLAISPPGGVSMILPFLPEGAHVILLNYMIAKTVDGVVHAEGTRSSRQVHQECLGCSWTMEAELWRHVRHVHKLFYQVWAAEDFANGRPGRDSAVVVKLPRLSYLIRVALDAMDVEPSSDTSTV
ncbi:hypothetical protein AB1Y20_018000 [Prymnesium parvum]|uniref:Uncharacterized protein n=1 Tax=Prymnesium parvum TaxID=97485 RepID=A0AB34JN89_PRYPA